jgi:hypothetical protein
MIVVVVVVVVLRMQIIATVPPRYRHNRWSCLYSVSRHGVSFKTMYRNVEDVRGTIVLIHDNYDRVW